MKAKGCDIRIDAATVSFTKKILSDKEIMFSLLECIDEISDSHKNYDSLMETPSLTKQVKES